MDSKEEFKKIYHECIKRPGADKMLRYLEETDFFIAPCSTRFHLCRPGGLAEHSIHVFKRLKNLYKQEFAPDRELTEDEIETCAIVGLLHDVCKINCYHEEFKNKKTYDKDKISSVERRMVKHDEGGDFIWETVKGYRFSDPAPFGHGEKSCMAISHYLKLQTHELMSVRWHMGFSDTDFQGGGRSVGTAFEMYPLAVLTHIADLQATYLDETADSS